jgi:hypothetical protein
MPVLMNGTPIVPAPFVGMSRQFIVAEDGTKLGQTYQITLTGSLVTCPPDATPVLSDAKLGVLLAKQNALIKQFSENGKLFEIYSPDGTNVIHCNPKVISFDLTSGNWVERTEYTIVLEAQNIFPDDFVPEQKVSDIRDQWNIQEAGFATEAGSYDIKPLWEITHTVSAVGKLVYELNGTLDPDKAPWKQARDWVMNRLETSTFSGRPFDTSGEMNLTAGGTGYNHTRTEEVDMVGGSFTINEKWILAYSSPATEEYVISVNKTPSEVVGNTVSINGTIRGLANGLNQLGTRINNAIAYFNESVKSSLYYRAAAAAPDVTLSNYGTALKLDENHLEGTISYSCEFNDKKSPAGTETVYDNYTVNKKTNLDEIETSVTVSGTIVGRLPIDQSYSLLLKYQKAKDYWDTISSDGTLLTRANESGVSGLKQASLQSSVDFNIAEGVITYSIDFNNRINNNVKNDYTIDIKTSREEARTTLGIQGTIVGLRENDSDPISTKYDNALAFWTSWKTQLYTIVSTFYGDFPLNPIPASTSVGTNPIVGNISYTYEYTTDAQPSIVGALTQQVTVSYTNPSDVFASIGVLNRLAGPILQSIGSKTQRQKSVSIDVVMAKGYAQPNTDVLIASYAPTNTAKVFVSQNEETWQENTNHYTRAYAWTYELNQ